MVTDMSHKSSALSHMKAPACADGMSARVSVWACGDIGCAIASIPHRNE